MSEIMEYTPQQKEIMLETVAKGCRPEQFMLMMELAKKYKLDPFARQIWATPMGIIIGRDGFLSLAHNSGDFDGMETTFEEREGKLFSATCTVYHKKMNHPIKVTVRFEEFYKPTPAGKQPGAWDKMPYVMLQKVAESHGLRRAFSVCGLYDESEVLTFHSAEEMPESDYTDAEYQIKEESKPEVTSKQEPKPEPKHEAPKQEPKKEKEQPKQEQKAGFCSCGCDAMPEEFRNKFSVSFWDVFEVRLPGDICEKCARDLWAKLMDEKKKKAFKGAE